ncbi:MAG TPA: proton-coupled thiamine transporter YuaJ [Clostridiales bacterium]|nr:proton-coupled thiamine transporter YuaJ [Clostridiales bacterium]
MFQKVFDFLVATVDEGGDISYYPTAAGNIALVVVIILLFVAMLAITGTRNKKLNAKQLAFSAVAITLAVVTSLYTIVQLPFGGSITLFRMFFICLIGYLYGPKVGFLTGVAYGFLDLMLEPYVVHPVQLLLDYPIAFGCLGLSGLFAKSKLGLVKGYAFGVFGRYLCHVLSGLIFFSVYAGSQNPVVYSVAYNATYILPEAVLTVVILLIPAVQKGLNEVKRMTVES